MPSRRDNRDHSHRPGAKFVAFWLDENDSVKLKKLASESGLTISEFIRRAVMEAAKNAKENQNKNQD